MPRKQNGLFVVLEELLKTANRPVTCLDLWDRQEVRDIAESSNRVSDYLGHMWRKGLARRVPAPKSLNSEARYAYTWNWGNEHEAQTGTKLSAPVEEKLDVRTILDRPTVQITEDGDEITITLPKLSITIKTTP